MKELKVGERITITLEVVEQQEASFEETFGMYGESDSLEKGFICGAKWAINEF